MKKECFYDPDGLFTWNGFFPKIHSISRKMMFLANSPIEQFTGIWKLEPTGGEITLLFENASYPNFSPDGNRIVFSRYSRQLANLWIINWDGTGLTQLTEPLNP